MTPRKCFTKSQSPSLPPACEGRGLHGPWRDPAVGHQASDRAHRIGQTRPVTVYKLVLAGSIEEQILALHGAKRELIDQVIGEQSAASIGVEELMALLEN